MEQEKMQELITITERMAVAAEALQATVGRLQEQSAELSGKIERIVAAVEEKEQAIEKKISAARKTLPWALNTLLAKSGVEVQEGMDLEALDASLKALSVEQRIAVKSEMARAGLI